MAMLLARAQVANCTSGRAFAEYSGLSFWKLLGGVLLEEGVVGRGVSEAGLCTQGLDKPL